MLRPGRLPGLLLPLLLPLCVPPAAATVLQLGEPLPAAVETPLGDYVAAWPDGAAVRSDPLLQHRLRQDVTAWLATEGYFTPQLRYEAESDVLAVVPGPRTQVSAVELQFTGAIDADRRAREAAAWLLPVGAAFRQADWERAKATLLRQLLENEFPAASLTDSLAEVDPARQRARLVVTVDSGPAHVFDGLRIDGAERFGLPILERFNTSVRSGAPYRTSDLYTLQQTLQASPYYTQVNVRTEPVLDGESPVAVPVVVDVQERPPYRISTGLGVSSNYGMRGDLGFRSIDFLQRAWELSSHLRWEQRRQSVFADVFLPPDHRQRRDSVGVAYSQTDISGLRVERTAFGVSRKIPRDRREAVLGLVQERFRTTEESGESSVIRVLVPSLRLALWRLDDRLAPREGWLLASELSGAGKRLGSDSNFVRATLAGHWFTRLGSNTDLGLRLEVGQTWTDEPDGVPTPYLFRTGGSQTVRGYAFESLGVQEGGSVTGGRRLLVGSVELTQWLSGPWGVALFVDAGEAQDAVRDLLRPAVGYGLGLRWRSPIGPLALDAAYGERTQDWRLHFALAIPF